MSISGHKTEKSFLKYIKVNQSEHAQMMKEEWNNIYTKNNKMKRSSITEAIQGSEPDRLLDIPTHIV